MMRILILLAACSMAIAQRTWVVDMAGRPGTDHGDIPAAVAAAAPGDRVVVRSTGANLYTSPTIDKPLSLVALNTHQPAGGTAVAMAGVLRIQRIPAGTHVRVVGFEIDTNPFFPWGIEVTDCAGLVHLEGMFEFPGNTYTAVGVFRNCAYLRFHACTLAAFQLPMLFDRCTASFESSFVEAVMGTGFPAPPLMFEISSPTLRLVDSTVTLSDSVILGADQGRTNYPTAAFELLRSTVHIGPTNVVLGGTWNPFGTETFATGQGTVIRDPRALVRSEPITSTVVQRFEYQHHTACGQVDRNRSFLGSMTGPPNGFGVLALGFPLPSALPGPLGDLWLDPTQISFVAAGPLNEVGFTNRTLFCHANVPIEPFYSFQAGWLGPDGTFGLARPVTFMVGWEPGTQYP